VLKYDIVIIGAGIYGLYTSKIGKLRDKKILIIEKEKTCFSRASYINQARLHNGYHYPRSRETIKDVHNYFERFNKEFSYAINGKFKNIYAISKNNSFVTDKEYEEMFKKENIYLKKIDSKKYFKDNMVLSAYETEEYVFDMDIIKDKLLEDINKNNNIDIFYNSYIVNAKIKNEKYVLELNSKETIECDCVINTTYASINQVNKLFDIKPLNIKYELCEIALGNPSDQLKKLSFTIMDGSFFSIMPFGLTNLYSLTSVHYTPHKTSFNDTPEFKCQNKNENCKKVLDNCNTCKYKPLSKNKEMLELANSYLLDQYKFDYKSSLFTIKPILFESELDDSRPTIIKKHRSNPIFISCLSGKISTIYKMVDFIENNL